MIFNSRDLCGQKRFVFSLDMTYIQPYFPISQSSLLVLEVKQSF